MTPEDIIDTLGLEPHPEGWWFRGTFRAVSGGSECSTSTAIYYMLKADEQSCWHRVVDADEIWNWYAGALLMTLLGDAHGREELIWGANIVADERPQVVVSKGVWQSAGPRDGWAFVRLYCRSRPSVRRVRDGAGWVGAGTWLRRSRLTTFLRSCLRAAD